jgi:uncharacterized protein
MKSIFTFTFLMIISVISNGQINSQDYDSTLARKLGADEYGMKMYVLVILKTGPNNEKDKAKRDTLFAGHMRNITRLVNQNKLIVAGPLAENERSYRGIFILNVESLEEASNLLESDPTIREKILEPELYKWYGSAALPEYLKLSDRIRKKVH